MMDDYLHIMDFYVPLYRGKLVLIFTNSKDKVVKYLPDFKNESIYAHAWCKEYKNQQGFFIVLNFESEYRKITHGVITHEAIHTAHNIFWTFAVLSRISITMRRSRTWRNGLRTGCMSLSGGLSLRYNGEHKPLARSPTGTRHAFPVGFMLLLGTYLIGVNMEDFVKRFNLIFENLANAEISDSTIKVEINGRCIVFQADNIEIIGASGEGQN